MMRAGVVQRALGAAFAAVMLAAGCAWAADEAGVGEEAALRKQVSSLVEALAAARSEIDLLKARLDEMKLASRPAISLVPAREQAAAAGELRVLEANRELGLVVVNAGAALGMRPGRKFAVMRGGAVVCEVQVVDVREKIAGAAIVKMERGASFPSAGDRLVEATAQAR